MFVHLIIGQTVVKLMIFIFKFQQISILNFII